MLSKTSKIIAKSTRRFRRPIAVGTTLAFAFLLPGVTNIRSAELQIQNSQKEPIDSQYILTSEKFQALIDQTVALTPYNISTQQAILINSDFKENSRYSTSRTEFFRLLADLYTLDIPKSQNFNNSYFLSFPNGCQGIVTTIGKDYEFSLTLKVHHNSSVSVQGYSVQNGIVTKADIKSKTGIFDQKEAFVDQVKKIAGEVKCTWNKKNKRTNLTVNSLSVFPYTYEKSSRGQLVKIDELDSLYRSQTYEGLIAQDYEYRLAKIEVFLERFAFDIAKVNEIILKHKSVAPMALNILKKDNGHGIFFREIQGVYPKDEEWYRLKAPTTQPINLPFPKEESYDEHSNLGRSAGSDDTDYSGSENYIFRVENSY